MTEDAVRQAIAEAVGTMQGVATSLERAESRECGRHRIEALQRILRYHADNLLAVLPEVASVYHAARRDAR